MKAPDKIYVLPPEEGIVFNYWTDLSLENTYEYVRKDAIVEWANSWLAFKRSGIVLDDGFSYAMEELIKKLNSM